MQRQHDKINLRTDLYLTIYIKVTVFYINNINTCYCKYKVYSVHCTFYIIVYNIYYKDCLYNLFVMPITNNNKSPILKTHDNRKGAPSINTVNI